MGPGGGGSAIAPLEQLRREYEAADREALRLAERFRGEGAATPLTEQQLRELHIGVTNAFTARQRLLRAELAELQKQVRGLESSIDTRDRAAGTIIGRRIEDLLNPNLRWEVPAAKKSEPAPRNPTGMMPGGMGPPRAEARPSPLEGTWLAVQQGSNGELRPFKTKLTLTFIGNRYEYRHGAEERYAHGTWDCPTDPLDPKFFLLNLTRLFLRASGPTSPAGEQPHVENMIAKIEGDTLRMCSKFRTNGESRTDFATTPDDGRLLMVYQRLSSAEIEKFKTDDEQPGIAPGGTGFGTRNGGPPGR